LNEIDKFSRSLFAAAIVEPLPPDQGSAVSRNPAEWFAEEVHQHEPSLKAYLRGSFPSVRDVDDLVHDSYIRLLRQKAAAPVQSAKAFLFTVARHLALDRLRSARRSPVHSVSDISEINVHDERANVTEAVSKNEKIRLLLDAIDSLPSRCRQVVVLRKLKLRSQKDVAAELGISEKGVEIQLSRGIIKCRKFFQKQGIHTFFDDEF